MWWCPEHVEIRSSENSIFPQLPQWKTLLLFSAGFSTSVVPCHMQRTWSRSHPPQTAFCLDQEQLDLSRMLVQVGISLLAQIISRNAKLSSLSRASASDTYLRNFWIWETVFKSMQLLKITVQRESQSLKKKKKSDYWNEWTRWKTEQRGRGHWPAWLHCSAVGKIPYHPYYRQGRKPSSHLGCKQLPFWQYPVWRAALWR